MNPVRDTSGQKRTSKKGPRFRAATFEDYEQINRLGARHALKAKPFEEWANLWLGNPVYRELKDRWDIGWVLEDEQGQIVASVGNIPVRYELDGRRILAASSHAWVAEPEYRSASLLLLDHLINQAGVDLFVTTTLSALSAPGVGTFECQRVPAGVWDESAFWITGYRGFARSWLTLRGWPLGGLVGPPLGAAMFVGERLRRRRRPAAGGEVQACAGFDDRFDQFWQELKERHPHLLLAERTREVLEWHYRALLLSDRLWIAAVTEGPRILAYAVFDRSDKPAIGLKRVRLVDFQSLDGGPALLSPLLSWALSRCRDEGIHTLEYFGRWLGPGEPVDRLAPYRRKLPTWIFVYRANDPALAERLKDPQVWCPTLYDGDASLIR